MAGVKSLYGTDKKAEEAGVVIDYPGFRVTIARAGGANRRFKKAFDELVSPHQRAIEVDALPDALGEKLFARLFARGTVLNWETEVEGEWKQGIELEDGELMDFTEDNVVETFLQAPDFLTDLRMKAESAKTFRQSQREDDAGNS